MNSRLSRATIAKLPGTIAIPRYDRDAVTPGIVHLGVGALHRAHQAAYVDACLTDGAADWGIVGVSLRSPDPRDALAPKDGLYPPAARDGHGERLQVGGLVLSLLVRP